jgi:hypothetical protein
VRAGLGDRPTRTSSATILLVPSQITKIRITNESCIRPVLNVAVAPRTSIAPPPTVLLSRQARYLVMGVIILKIISASLSVSALPAAADA